MFDLKVINSVINQLEEERGIPREKVMEAIECATKNEIPLVTNTVLNKKNLDSIEFVLETAKKYGFNVQNADSDSDSESDIEIEDDSKQSPSTIEKKVKSALKK